LPANDFVMPRISSAGGFGVIGKLFLAEIIGINSFHEVGSHLGYSDSVVDHQLRQLFTVNQDDLLRYCVYVNLSVL